MAAGSTAACFAQEVGPQQMQHRSYPDFFVEELNSFIEIKSEYTKNLHNEKLLNCKNELYNMGYGYYICVVRPNKSYQFIAYNIDHITGE